MDARAAARVRSPYVGAVRAGVALPRRSARPPRLHVLTQRGRRRPLGAAHHPHGRRPRWIRAHRQIRPAVGTPRLACRKT